MRTSNSKWRVSSGDSPAPLWLEVERSGNSWTHRYSTDGTTWTDTGSFSHTLAVTAVGVFAGNYPEGTAPAFEAEIDYFFETSSPVVPEDPVTCGNGTVDAGEGCDDGNTVDGDGCSASCQPE